jgi:hypothetical protein
VGEGSCNKQDPVPALERPGIVSRRVVVILDAMKVPLSCVEYEWVDRIRPRPLRFIPNPA